MSIGTNPISVITGDNEPGGSWRDAAWLKTLLGWQKFGQYLKVVDVDRWLAKRLGSIALSSLTTIDLARYRDARLTDHVRRGAGIKGGGTVDLPRGRPKLDHRRSNILALPPGRNRTLTADEAERLRQACAIGEGASDGA